MFAMLTGSLPYNLERFNIIDMYHKMMERKMMPFPSHVSRGKASFYHVGYSSLLRGKHNGLF